MDDVAHSSSLPPSIPPHLTQTVLEQLSRLSLQSNSSLESSTTSLNPLSVTARPHPEPPLRASDLVYPTHHAVTASSDLNQDSVLLFRPTHVFHPTSISSILSSLEHEDLRSLSHSLLPSDAPSDDDDDEEDDDDDDDDNSSSSTSDSESSESESDNSTTLDAEQGPVSPGRRPGTNRPCRAGMHRQKSRSNRFDTQDLFRVAGVSVPLPSWAPGAPANYKSSFLASLQHPTVDTLSLERAPISNLASLRVAFHFPRITVLSLVGTKINDPLDVLNSLASASWLRLLDLRRTPLYDAAGKPTIPAIDLKDKLMEKLPILELFNGQFTPVSGEWAVKHLADARSLAHVKSINLSNKGLTGVPTATFPSMVQLRDIDLTHNPDLAVEAWAETLASVPSLRAVWVDSQHEPLFKAALASRPPILSAQQRFTAGRSALAVIRDREKTARAERVALDRASYEAEVAKVLHADEHGHAPPSFCGVDELPPGASKEDWGSRQTRMHRLIQEKASIIEELRAEPSPLGAVTLPPDLVKEALARAAPPPTERGLYAAAASQVASDIVAPPVRINPGSEYRERSSLIAQLEVVIWKSLSSAIDSEHVLLPDTYVRGIAFTADESKANVSVIAFNHDGNVYSFVRPLKPIAPGEPLVQLGLSSTAALNPQAALALSLAWAAPLSTSLSSWITADDSKVYLEAVGDRREALEIVRAARAQALAEAEAALTKARIERRAARRAARAAQLKSMNAEQAAAFLKAETDAAAASHVAAAEASSQAVIDPVTAEQHKAVGAARNDAMARAEHKFEARDAAAAALESVKSSAYQKYLTDVSAFQNDALKAHDLWEATESPFLDLLCSPRQRALFIDSVFGVVDWALPSYSIPEHIEAWMGDWLEREEDGDDNHWISRPSQRPSSLSLLGSTLPTLLRPLVESGGHGLLSKALDDPCLMYGHRFELKFVVALRSISPLTLGIYDEFAAFAAEDVFSLDSYSSEAKHGASVLLPRKEFVDHFHAQYGGLIGWPAVQASIYTAMTEMWAGLAEAHGGHHLGTPPTHAPQKLVPEDALPDPDPMAGSDTSESEDEAANVTEITLDPRLELQDLASTPGAYEFTWVLNSVFQPVLDSITPLSRSSLLVSSSLDAWKDLGLFLRVNGAHPRFSLMKPSFAGLK